MSFFKEYMQQSMTRDFETPKTKIYEETILQVEVVKRLVGRPRDKLKATLLYPNVEEEEPTSKKLKIKGHYINWFEHSIWDSVYDVVRKHRIINNAYKYLKKMYKEIGRELWYLR